MIEKLHKGDTITKVQIEPNEGERTLLCSNESDQRSPFLGSIEELQKFEEIKPILQTLFSKIIEREINNYLVELNEKTK